MHYRNHRLSDPVEQLFETQPFEAKRHRVTSAFCQASCVQPHPQVAKHEGHDHEYQTQVRVARTGVDARLMHLAKARFDAETLAVAFANLRRRAMDPPGGKEKFLELAFVVVAIAPIR